MASVEIRRPDGSSTGSVDLDASIFGIAPNPAVMHQVVTAQLAAARRGTHSTLSRAEARGGGRKPWRQKGTGRARQGSIRAPHWRGGSVALGPKPRDYSQKTPKKMVQLALRSALSDRASSGRVAVVDRWEFSVPKTKEAKAALGALGLEGHVLLVLAPDEIVTAKAFRNLTDVHVISVTELNTYDVLCSDWVVFTRDTLPGAASEAPAASAPEAPAAPAPEASTVEVAPGPEAAAASEEVAP